MKVVDVRELSFILKNRKEISNYSKEKIKLGAKNLESLFLNGPDSFIGNSKKLATDFKNNITPKIYFLNATGEFSAYLSIFVLLEAFLVGDDASLNLRTNGVGVTYFGGGLLFKAFRDYFQRKNNITSESSEKEIKWNDRKVLMGLNAVYAPISAYIAGAESLSDYASVLGIKVGMGYITAPWLGRGVDYIQDLFGIKESKRVPEKIRNLDKNVKKCIGFAFPAVSILLSTGIYALSPSKFEGNNYFGYDEREPTIDQQEIQKVPRDTSTIYYKTNPSLDKKLERML